MIRTTSVLKTFLTFSVYFFLYTSSQAQNGWDHIRDNDFKKASEVFTAALEKDSTDLNALKGMIFISETTGDTRSHKKYTNTLLNNHWSEDYYLLFGSDYDGDMEKLLEKSEASERIKIEARLSKADDFYKKRKKEDSYNYYKEVFGDYKWTFLGPFDNVNGSSFIENFPVENDPYDTSKVYVDEDGDELKWVDPPYRNRRSMINYGDHLKTSYSSQAFFSNTFIELPEKRKVQLRITRYSPMKIWVDDQLVFDNNDNISMEWDNELVELEMEPGTHRILVKQASYNRGGGSRLSGLYQRPITGSYEYDDDDIFSMDRSSFGTYRGKRSHYSGDFEIRITDKDGKLFKDIRSSSTGIYSPKKYSPEIKSLFVLNHIKEEITKNESDLFNYFSLLLAYEKYSQEIQGEESIVNYYRKNKDKVFAKYLAYRIYFDNGKREKAYEVLNDINQTKTPIFDLLFQKLGEIDEVNDEEKYLDALHELESISPSNFDVIEKYIKYYDSKDMIEEKEEYIKSLIKKYPDYEDFLKDELKKNLDEKKQLERELLKDKQEYSYKKSIKVLIKDVKTSFYPSDYYSLIKHYKARDEYDKIMQLFSELEETEPYEADHYYKKADFLLEEEKYELALSEMNNALKLRPFDGTYYEMIGDIYYEKKEKDKALHYYKLSKKLSGNESGGWFKSGSSISSKIEKIEGQKQLKKIFNTPSFQDILDKQSEWEKKYSDEDAVVLMYSRDIVVDSTNHGEAFDKIMIKILSDAGIKTWLEYDFSYLGKIKSAKIIKKSGAEVIPDGYGGYKVFKNLEPGDIIQVEASFQFEVTKGLEENNYFHTYLNFESPTYYSKLEVAVPAGAFFSYFPNKVPDNLVKTTDKGYDFYKWEYKELSKLATEEATIDRFDYYASMMISFVKDWNKVAKWYDQMTYRKLEANYEVKEILDTIIKPEMTDKQKVETIYNFLTREVKYSFVPFLQSGYIPKDPGLTICSRIGDCKDVATLMITMLREVGIESYYVLVKTNDYFHAKILPSIYFNHVVAGYYLDGKLCFSDMTTDFYPYYILPEMDANAWALLIKENGGELFQLPKDNIDKEKNKAEVNVTAKLSTDRSVDLKVHATHRGIIGGNIREKFAMSNKEEQKNYIMDMMGKGIFENADLTDYTFHNMLDISSPLESDYNINIFNYCDRVSGMLVFRVPFTTAITAHPAILSKTRYNALNLSEIVRIEPTLQKVTVEFPQGFDLLEMPKDIEIRSEFGLYKVTFKRVKNGLYIEKFQAFNNAVIEVKDFQKFKEFYLQILDFDSSKIALKKK